MADLALSRSLIDEYIKYKFNEPFDTDKMRKLLKYIQPFAIRITHSEFFADPSTAGQFADPLIEIIEDCSDEEMVQNSILKLMLIDEAILPVPTFTTLNILNTYEKLQPKYGASYPNSTDKNKAQKHIKALLSDARWVKITDSYIANNWNINKDLIQQLLPSHQCDVKILGGNGRNQLEISPSQKSQLKSICADWKIQTQPVGSNIHDRYIETDKVKILLSSGLYHLSSSSNKDFTYIVEIKP